MDKIRRWLLATADAREASWDSETKAYQLTIEQAAEKVVEEVEYRPLIYLLLLVAWNDALAL